MKKHKVGDISKGMCSTCKKLVSTTFQIKNVPFSDGYGLVKNVLVAICDNCEKVVSFPPEATPVIKQALRERRDALGLGYPVETLHQKALKFLEGKKQTEVAKITGIKQPQISRIKKGFQSRDTQAILKIIEVLGNTKIIGPFYQENQQGISADA